MCAVWRRGDLQDSRDLCNQDRVELELVHHRQPLWTIEITCRFMVKKLKVKWDSKNKQTNQEGG